MNKDPLEDILREYSESGIPSESPYLRQQVRKSIDCRRGKWSINKLFPILDWREIVAQRSLTAAALATALVVGMLPVAFAVRGREADLVRASLHFDVFIPPMGRGYVPSAGTLLP